MSNINFFNFRKVLEQRLNSHFPICGPDEGPRLAATFLGYMVLEGADLWQEAQDRFGEGADGLMRAMLRQAEILATAYQVMEQSADLAGTLHALQSKVDTMFEWEVVDTYSRWLLGKFALGEYNDYVAFDNYRLDLIASWFTQTPLDEVTDAVWYLELENRTEGFYSSEKRLTAAVDACLAYYGNDTIIYKIERLKS